MPGWDNCHASYRFNILTTRLAAQAMTDLAERDPLGVRELQSTFQLGLQDAVFGGQIFVPRQQLLVHRPRDVGQDARQLHEPPLPSCRPIHDGRL